MLEDVGGFFSLFLFFDSTHMRHWHLFSAVGVDPPDTLQLVAFLINALLCRYETESVINKKRNRHRNVNVKRQKPTGNEKPRWREEEKHETRW